MERAIRQQFLTEYSHIRHAEGRGSADAEYYLALPDRDLTGINTAQWTIRARSWHYFERHLLPALEREAGRPLHILDLGAGNGWMSYRLAVRNHQPVAVDIFADARDGIGAVRHYPVRFSAIEAEFDSLPFPDGAFDLAIFNSSIHYSTDYRRTLAEARRCLRSSGSVVIMDSPVYKRREHGERMRAERHERFQREYGFRSDAVSSMEFFDEDTLAALAHDLGIEWRRSKPWYGIRWAMRPWIASLRGRRPPSRFFILTGKFRNS